MTFVMGHISLHQDFSVTAGIFQNSLCACFPNEFQKCQSCLQRHLGWKRVGTQVAFLGSLKAKGSRIEWLRSVAGWGASGLCILLAGPMWPSLALSSQAPVPSFGVPFLLREQDRWEWGGSFGATCPSCGCTWNGTVSLHSKVPI